MSELDPKANSPKPQHNKEPKVSIIIISYNQQEFIAEAIEGAVTQAYDNLEVVVSDDGSTDNTQEIIKAFSVRYPGRLIPLLNKHNVGVTANCNRALNVCTGELIALVGGDDVILPNKIASQVEWFGRMPHRVLCAHLGQNIYADGTLMHDGSDRRPRKKFAGGFGPINIIMRNFIPYPTSVMVRASAIPAYGFDPEVTVASDFLFWIDVLAGGGEYGCLDEVFAHRRRHGNNVSNDQDKMFSDLALSYKIIENRYPAYRGICRKTSVRHVIYYYGVIRLKENYLDLELATSLFINAIKIEPFYLKAWVRLCQSLYRRSVRVLKKRMQRKGG